MACSAHTTWLLRTDWYRQSKAKKLGNNLGERGHCQTWSYGSETLETSRKQKWKFVGGGFQN